MLHQRIKGAPLDAVLKVTEEAGAAPCLDRLAETGRDSRRFLRAAWFAAAAAHGPVRTLAALRGDGEPAAAIPLVARGPAWLGLGEVPGSYWPFRSFPIAGDAGDAELSALLASPALGRAWRLGPVYADDPALARLAGLAAGGGWTLLKRRLAISYRVDLKRLLAAGPWPSTKTLRKNRWCERRLAELGELEFADVSGGDWSEATLDSLAAIEAESWVGAQGGDTKFTDPGMRRLWTRALDDPVLAGQLSCSLLHIAGAPAAFTFSVTSGTTRYYIANGYSARFAERSPGRILLYRDFAAAATAGVETIGWGAGDPGYKTEMGAEPGPEIVDCLFVRGRVLGALARPFWERRG